MILQAKSFHNTKHNILCINKFGGKNNSPPKKCNQKTAIIFFYYLVPW